MLAPKTSLADELREKEIGVVGHFLDGFISEAPRSAVVTVGLGAALVHFQGVFSPMILAASLAVGQIVSAARGMSNFLEARANARSFDQPRVQAYLRRMQEHSRDVTVAAKRGTAWIVMYPGSQHVEAMSEVEYARFKSQCIAARASINEVRVVRRKVSNTRIRSGFTFAPEERRIADITPPSNLRYSASRFLAVGSGITEEPALGSAAAPVTASPEAAARA